MVEIAISLAVVAFALVAIIGVLPRGLNAQRDNRTESTINLDAQYWMDALRSSSQGADELTNYVKAIHINDNGTDVTFTFGSPGATTFSNGRDIVGLVSNPEPSANIRVDTVAINGSAVEKTGPDSEVAFGYRMYVRIEAAKNVALTNAVVSETSLAENQQALKYLMREIYSIRLEFAWPLVNGRPGNGRQTYRNVVQGWLLEDPADKRLNFFTR